MPGRKKYRNEADFNVQRDVMRLEAEIDAKREAQYKVLLARIRAIQDARGERSAFEIEMSHDPASDDYSVSIANRVGMFADVADKIDELLGDYSFVFAGKRGTARIGEKTESIEFIS